MAPRRKQSSHACGLNKGEQGFEVWGHSPPVDIIPADDPGLVRVLPIVKTVRIPVTSRAKADDLGEISDVWDEAGGIFGATRRWLVGIHREGLQVIVFTLDPRHRGICFQMGMPAISLGIDGF